MLDDTLLRTLTTRTYPADPHPAPLALADVVNTVQCMDALELLRRLPDGCVDCIVTSPPYYGLRDYGTASWIGGDPDCQHVTGNQVQDTKAPGAIVSGVRPGSNNHQCRKCGATRIDNQIGLEDTPQAYVDRLVRLFREARRVLKDSGTLWLNLGDSYSSDVGGKCDLGRDQFSKHARTKGYEYHIQSNRNGQTGLPAKNLIGIPWRVALALQADGWYLRSDIIWSKPNPMPESVTDRPTKAHEYIFLLAKSERYYYDGDAIREPIAIESIHKANGKDRRLANNKYSADYGGNMHGHSGMTQNGSVRFSDTSRNRRSVWSVATEPSPYPHFAMWPQKLIEPMVLAGCPAGGIVLDPFGGSGTTGLVARRLGRRYLLCDLSPEYVELARKRLAEPYTLPMFTDAPAPDAAQQIALFGDEVGE